MESKFFTIHFPIPEGYTTSDHYLKHLVMEQLKRPDNFSNDEFGKFLLKAKNDIQHSEILDEKERNQLADKILFVFTYTCVKEELSYIEKAGLADRYLMIWDYVRAVRNKGFIVGCERNLNADNYVAYCLGITNTEPDHAGVPVEKLSFPGGIKLSANGVRFTKEYLLEKYGTAYFPRLKSGNYNFNMFNFRYNYHIDLIECAITFIGSKDKIDPSVLQASDSEIEVWLEQHYPREYQLASSKAKENYKLVYNIL